MIKLHETHNAYILDVLEDDKNNIMKEILNANPNLEYNLNRLIEVVAEIEERNNNTAN